MKRNLGTPYSVQCKPNEHAVPYSADRGSGGDFFTVSGFLWKRGTLWKTKELAVRSQIINILWSQASVFFYVFSNFFGHRPHC